MTSTARTLVAISRQVGAGGAYVGHALSQRLGIRYVDRELLQEAAKVLGRDDQELEGLEERVASVWSRMAGVLSWGAPEAPYVPPPIPTVYEEDLFQVQARIIREIASREDAVFVGRAASWVLRGQEGLISVFLHAPEEFRLGRVREAYKLADGEARELTRQSDHQRSRFLHALHGTRWTDCGCYDLCINTSSVHLDDVVETLVGLIGRRRGTA